jgi:hypothetical protein
MRAYSFICKVVGGLSLTLLFSTNHWAFGQQQDQPVSLLKDSVVKSNDLNMDAVYNRPFLSLGKLPVAVGGYAEAKMEQGFTDGINSGISFQSQRFTLFFSSSPGRKIRFLSELEFEEGTREINIEFAACDVEFHPLLNLRGGIIMNPIGAFNQNHDGPKWDFVDRPIVSTALIPSTLSNVGFGLHGKYYSRPLTIGYEVYATNGFDESIIDNAENRTSLAAGKMNPFRFAQSSNGAPMLTGKLAFRNRKVGELGISYLTGIYNQFMVDGFAVDQKRRASIFAIDFNTALFRNKLTLTGEMARVLVDVPDSYVQNYGEEQLGAFLDIMATVMQRPIASWEKAEVRAGVRLEYVDFNRGKFRETGESIGDEQVAIVPSIAFRPGGSTVLRINYRWSEQNGLLNNPKSYSSVFQLGISTYF